MNMNVGLVLRVYGLRLEFHRLLVGHLFIFLILRGMGLAERALLYVGGLRML